MLGHPVVIEIRVERRDMDMTEITGGSPYGAGTLAGGDGRRQPSQNELKIAHFQGSHVAGVAKKQSA